MNIERGFKLAKNASTFSDRKIKIGAVLMYKSKVISVGYNTTKSSPIQKMYNVYRNIDGREYDVEKRANGIHATHLKDILLNIIIKQFTFIQTEQLHGVLIKIVVNL